MSRISNKNFIVLLMLVIITIATIFCSGYSIVYAESNTDFERTDVMDDLNSMTVEGKPFNIKEYPYVNNDIIKPKILTFVEYCYSVNDKILKNNYGLYIYFYNPKANSEYTIDHYSTLNTVQMASSYLNGKPSDYHKFRLKYISKSSGDQFNKFYKFKVVDEAIKIGGKTTYFKDRVNSEQRRYDISGIELNIKTKDGSKLIDFEFGNTYMFSGYAKGCGPDKTAESTLKSKTTELDTLKLNVNQCTFRTESSSLGKGHRNQLTSVYFTIPNDYIVRYGNLIGVKAEWWEFKTKPIFVTTNVNDYNLMMSKRTDHLNVSYVHGGPYYYTKNPAIKGYPKLYWGRTGNDHFQYGYNIDTYYSRPGSTVPKPYVANYYTNIPFVFKTNNRESYDVNYNSVLSYMKSYPYDSNSVFKYKMPNSNEYKTFNYSKYLFSDDLVTIDPNHKRVAGYNVREFRLDNLDDSYNFETGNINQYEWYEKWWKYLFNNNSIPSDIDTQFKNVAPIQKLSYNDIMSKTDEDIRNGYYIDYEYIDSIKQAVKNAESTGATVHKLNFALTDYYSSELMSTKEAYGTSTPVITNENAYMAEQSVFLDFDIIYLRFRNDIGDTIIPVVSNPIDIVGSVVSPPGFDNGNNIFKILLFILIMIILMLLLVPLFPYIVNFIVMTVNGVVKIVKLPFKAIKNSRQKHKKKNNKRGET